MRYTEYHSGKLVIKDNALLSEAREKLAGYEDTGLTPEQVQELKERDAAKRLNSCECVSCGNELMWMKDSGTEFCPWCGQRLDWSE